MGFACGMLNLEFVSLVGSVPSILRFFLFNSCSNSILLRGKCVVDLTKVASKHRSLSRGDCCSLCSLSAVYFVIVCHTNCVPLSEVQ